MMRAQAKKYFSAMFDITIECGFASSKNASEVPGLRRLRGVCAGLRAVVRLGHGKVPRTFFALGLIRNFR